MNLIDARNISTKNLEDYDDMMIEATIKVEKFAPIAVSIWSEVLRELENRGRAKILSGSYDDIGNALFQRFREKW